MINMSFAQYGSTIFMTKENKKNQTNKQTKQNKKKNANVYTMSFFNVL